jgi:hypothetical protein
MVKEADMKKMWIQTQSEGRYLVGAGSVRHSVFARDRSDALKKVKAKLSAADRAAISSAPRRVDK